MTTLLTKLLIMNILDFFTGFLNAVLKGNVQSKSMRRGIMYKILIWIVVTVAYLLSDIVKVNLLEPVIIFYIFMEVISVLENILDYIPLPEQLKEILAKYKGS